MSGKQKKSDPYISKMMPRETLHGSVHWRQMGNQHYLSARKDGIAPIVRKTRYEEALQCYNRALQEATTGDHLAAAHKNISKAMWGIGSNIDHCEENVKKFTFYYKEALSHFSKALRYGLTCNPIAWMQDLSASFRTCLEEAMESVSCFREELRVRYIESYIGEIDDSMTMFKTDCYKEMAQVLFHQAVKCLESDDYKTSLHALKECYRPIEEMKRYGRGDEGIQSEARILEGDVSMQTASAESLQAVDIGDKLLQQALLYEENLNMDLLYDVLDWYKKAAIVTREIEIEREAIAMSRLGKVFDQVLKIRYRSKDYFMQCVYLAHSLAPKVFTTESWYRTAADSLERFQQESLVEQEKREYEQRKQFIEELKKERKTLRELEEKDYPDMLLGIYKSFPPKKKEHKLPAEKALRKMDLVEMKKVYQKAILHYHPDKQDAEKYGKKWKVLCDEITKALTKVYERFKL